MIDSQETAAGKREIHCDIFVTDQLQKYPNNVY